MSLDANNCPNSHAPYMTPTLAQSGSFASFVELEECKKVPITDTARTTTNAAEIQMAYSRIRPLIPKTPLTHAQQSLLPGFNVYLKNEQYNKAGSYKCRGALNTLLLLTEEEKKRGVMTASAGNHSSGLSCFARKLGIPCSVLMPKVTPIAKRQMCVDYGAKVEIIGEHLNETREIAMERAEKDKLVYVHGFNDYSIINGAASVGIEALEQNPDLQAFVIPIGGMGLIAGVAAAVKQRNPSIKIIGVQSESCPSGQASHAAGKPVKVDVKPTLCEGTHVQLVGPQAFEIADPLIDEYITVSESMVCLALVKLMEVQKIVVEGSACLSIAAFMSGKLNHLRHLQTCCILTGGNFDITSIAKVIERGLYVDCRMLRIRVALPNSPGSLMGFLQVPASVGASIKNIMQENSYSQSNSVYIRATIETRNVMHTKELIGALTAAGYTDLEIETDNADSAQDRFVSASAENSPLMNAPPIISISHSVPRGGTLVEDNVASVVTSVTAASASASGSSSSQGSSTTAPSEETAGSSAFKKPLPELKF